MRRQRSAPGHGRLSKLMAPRHCQGRIQLFSQGVATFLIITIRGWRKTFRGFVKILHTENYSKKKGFSSNKSRHCAYIIYRHGISSHLYSGFHITLSLLPSTGGFIKHYLSSHLQGVSYNIIFLAIYRGFHKTLSF